MGARNFACAIAPRRDSSLRKKRFAQNDTEEQRQKPQNFATAAKLCATRQQDAGWSPPVRRHRNSRKEQSGIEFRWKCAPESAERTAALQKGKAGLLRQWAIGFFAEGGDPTFGALFDDLNVGEAGAREEFAVLVGAKEGDAESRAMLFEEL